MVVAPACGDLKVDIAYGSMMVYDMCIYIYKYTIFYIISNYMLLKRFQIYGYMIQVHWLTLLILDSDVFPSGCSDWHFGVQTLSPEAWRFWAAGKMPSVLCGSLARLAMVERGTAYTSAMIRMEQETQRHVFLCLNHRQKKVLLCAPIRGSFLRANSFALLSFLVSECVRDIHIYI